LDISFAEAETYEFRGVSGEISRGYISQVDIQLKDTEIKSEVVFSQAISKQGYGILGQQGFFDHFKITFNFQDLLVELKK